jgi:hypothetical protein
MIDDVTIKRKILGDIIIQVPHLKNNIYGSLFYRKDNIYKTKSLYRQNEIFQYLTDNNFIIIVNHEILNNNYNKYAFQLTLKSMLRIV